MKLENSLYARFGKRLLDLTMAIPGLLILFPLMATIALFVRLKVGRPVLFRQVRPGLGGKPFTLYKFRTMSDDRDQEWRLCCLMPKDWEGWGDFCAGAAWMNCRSCSMS
jgi:lipopolysaccharide/colanic/teichoic acid biosynthesis glycosyltransferase